ncbi:MAG: Asp-tRNA(Asn)/Glu-tRNA(Gln) amidotransferase subunit GatA [candidate division Zixibacteria bacterium]|nr:Asp-tRNA(Asn)/Glu-tRNA(Gln) amidotransferase subunit GatA [candidate division Zixibacteria bacterium]MBU1469373.1 Asp-tRNA(Asn)/Glu-tRNA(Gln) amidotransferase subunit GatA [candidate division Zixibacteria bacterium]MBU2626044.1 Asp-tRNA(Asn)/Glu-tRNA(Gln) amidotransferase subunit GatA [candidate division Zixibacteria bacterium]
MNIQRASAEEIHRRTVCGELDPIETAEIFSDSAQRSQANLNSFIALTPYLALRSAEEVKSRLEKRESLGSLAGVPVAVKDNICLEGYPTTCASRILADFRPPYNATVVEKLIDAGALIIGKTNLDEFAMGSTTESSYFGSAKNPLNSEYSPGGSSGGSASAVASFHVAVALGSDTGGSIRQPASLTGIVGLKPTYGAVSRYGLIAYASSFDQIGPFARNVRDTAMLYAAIAGRDRRDSTSVDNDTTNLMSAIDQFKPVRIGVPREYFGEGLDDDVGRAVGSALETAKSIGCEIVDLSMPILDKAIAAYYVIATAEASSNLARYDGVQFGQRSPRAAAMQEMYSNTRSEGFGDEVKRRIMLGTYVLSSGYYEEYYQKAMQVREIIRRDIMHAFDKADVIVTPTSPTAGIRLGEKIDNPLSMYLADVYTVIANLTGTCAMSIPCGHGAFGLPIGVQVIGKHFDEMNLFRLAHRLESALDFRAGEDD